MKPDSKKPEGTPRKVTPVRRELTRTTTGIKAGPTRRMEDFGDFVGNVAA